MVRRYKFILRFAPREALSQPQEGEIDMGEIVHTSHIKIEQDIPPLRRALIEDFKDPVPYGVHGGIAAFYGIQPKEEIPATLDHMIAAIAA